MNNSDENDKSTAKALIAFGKIIVEDRKEIREDIKELNSAVKELIKTGIEARKDREYDSNRMERVEVNQKEQGKELKHISDTVLLLDDRMKANKSRWDKQDTFKATVFAGIMIIALSAYFGLR